MYVCMYVCVYIYIYIYISPSNKVGSINLYSTIYVLLYNCKTCMCRQARRTLSVNSGP